MLRQFAFASVLVAVFTSQSFADCWDNCCGNWSAFANACECEGGRPVPNPPRCYHDGGGGFTPVPPPDPKVLALQRANVRYGDLIRKWRSDFGFITDGNAQEWLNLDRSSEDAFLGAADRLDRALVDQINWFKNDLGKDRDKVVWLERYPARAAAIRNNIGWIDRDIDRYGPPLATARQELDRLTQAGKQFQELQQKYKLRMQRDRWLAVEAWSVFLPRKYVRINADKAGDILRFAPMPLEGNALPFVDKKTPNLDVLPPWLLGKFDMSYLPYALAAAAQEPYHRLAGTPEEIIPVLEADERRAHDAFVTRNDYDMAHSERFDYEERVKEFEGLENQQNEKQRRLEDILEQRKQVYPELNAARVNVKSEATRLLDRASESLVWEIAKNTTIDMCRKAVKEVYHDKVMSLDLTDQDIFDHYKNGNYNLFNLPGTHFHVKDIKKVQNDILTLLRHGQDYARTAVRLAAQGDPAEIQEFVGGMFNELDKNSSELIKDSLSATSSMSEPGRTLVTRYFVGQLRKATADEQ